jgi:hypothetical protein
VQCEEHNEGDIKWIPFNDGMPGKIWIRICTQ